MRVQLVKEFSFEAAHSLPHAPEGHKCRRLHGHSFRVEVVLEGDVDPDTGWFVDYGDILAVVKPIVDDNLDHRFLNEVPGLENPTSEVLSRWLWDRIRPKLPALAEIVVRETCTVACRYRGTER